MVKKPLNTDAYIQHLYIYLNESDQFALFSGLTFAHFLDAMKLPKNLLLLKHPYEDASFNMHTHMEFATQEEFGQLRKARANKKSEFCWIDFKSEKQLNSLTPQEQAELLYIGHKKEPVKTPFYSTLQNEFVYLSSEEEETTKIYFRRLERLNELVGNYFTYLIRREENGQNFWRRKAKDLIPELPAEILQSLKKNYREGVLISLADPEKTKNTIELHIRPVEEISFLDEFWSDIEEYTKQGISRKIIYDRKQKIWK
ncbi:hypothetical protein A1A1_11096 [Planococcus antarcticus DSM 14505]|uniref:Oxalate:formate antiporter n=1 Tax=Planococcus antarcticus DSM 14505 TaxID=1185653 RepID=A0A1C7DBP4_9BACL|nr:hypothetical protein [Planococcus antarcticus]ANU08878.1 hypothetical protein BBH88_00270 [Planococcus antarcticus DSM 14505]EIM06410.1 hypothetical protein A1A1_11096 [Planococcus antarcticus DSM 14505]